MHLVSLVMVEGDHLGSNLPHNIIWVLDQELMVLQDQDPRVGFLLIKLVVPNSHQAALDLTAWDLIKARELLVHKE